MNLDFDAILSSQYFWLIKVLIYLFLTVVALKMWSMLRRRAKKIDPDKRTWKIILIRSVGPPINVMMIGLGLQQIMQTVIVNSLNIVDDDALSTIGNVSDSLVSLMIIGGMFWTMLRLVTAAENIYSRPVEFSGARIDRSAMQAIFRVLRYIIIVIAALTAMESLGVSISGLLAFGGVGGAVVAFAAKDTLSNFFSGVIIFTERPFAIGDWIRCPGTEVEGVVEKIGWRMTHLRTFDHRPLYVPNSMFSTNIIENPQRMTNRRIYEHLGVRYDDIDKMPALLQEIREMLIQHPDIDQSQIQMVNFDNYGASSLNFFIYVMTTTTKWREFHSIKEDVLFKVAAIVTKHDAQFAFPTRTLHHITPPEYNSHSNQANNEATS